MKSGEDRVQPFPPHLPLALGGYDDDSPSGLGYARSPHTPATPRPRFHSTMLLATTMEAKTSQPMITVTMV